MKKINFIFIFALLFLVFTLSFVYSAEGCCERLKNGAWCQATTSDKCTTTVAPTSCSSFSPCILGTCIDEDKGDCMPNTPKNLCLSKGGFWDSLPRSEISRCQNGCCLFGEYASFVTQTECKQLAYVYGVEITFRADVTEEFSCYALTSPDVKGACVNSNNESGISCSLTTKEGCLSEGGDFQEEYLCTAPELSTDCAKTDKTVCKDDKVYFTDTCGNLANVYDEKMYSKDPNKWTEEMEDYWTKIQEPICVVNPRDSSCGDCSYIAGSVCKDYKTGQKNMPAKKPVYGDKTCSNLNCHYDSDNDGTDEIYQHGESWCAHSEGVYPGINVSEDGLNFSNPSIAVENAKYFEYNIPGSRYYRLMCIDGEVIVEPCRDFRNEVCLQSDMGENTGEFKVAQCRINLWRDCFNLTKQEDCESNMFCKWIPGYRFDGKIVTSPDDRNMDEQCSCIPSFSPGFNFWEAGNEGSALCSLASIQENVVYETLVLTKRDKFKDNPLCDVSNDNDAVQRCFGSCYAIPGYGLEAPIEGGYSGINDGDYIDLDKLIALHSGANNALDKKLERYCISDRRGYYCE